MNQLWAILRNGTAGLALIATLAVALLPNGQVPKVSGPCGRALCNCPLEVTSTRNCANCAPARPRTELTLGASVLSCADAPGLAMQYVFDAGLPPRMAVHIVACSATPLRIPARNVRVPASIATEILTPPPRTA